MLPINGITIAGLVVSATTVKDADELMIMTGGGLESSKACGVKNDRWG